MKILVTGGSKGLGYQIVEELSKNKDNIIFATYNSHHPTEFGSIDNIQLIKVNFSEKNFIKKLDDKIQSIDCVINNYHSGYEFKHLYKFKSEEVLESFHINISPLIDLNNHYIKIMKRNKGGKIISILSELTKTAPSLGMAVYTAEKIYFKTLTDHWSKELSRFKIDLINISPKMLDTNFNSSIDPRYIDIIKRQGGFSKISDVIKLIKKILLNSEIYNGKNLII